MFEGPTAYENFIRRAFGVHNPSVGHMLDRIKDPAGLANTDAFSLADTDELTFIKVKAATIYAMSIIQKRIELEKDDSNLDTLADQQIAKAFKAKTVMDLHAAIESFKHNVEWVAFPPEPRP